MKKSEVSKTLLGNNQYKYTVDFTNQFKKDVVNAINSNLDINLLRIAIKILATDGKLPKEYKSHKLEGNLKGY